MGPPSRIVGHKTPPYLPHKPSLTHHLSKYELYIVFPNTRTTYISCATLKRSMTISHTLGIVSLS